MSSSYIDGLNQAATASNAASTSKAKDQTMGKEDFLKLLVAQLQNQDPLTPDNPTEFTAQLAQFSSLEQLQSLNESMKTLTTTSTTSQNMATLSTIGKQVAYSSDSFTYSGSPVTVGYKLDNPAAKVSVALQLNGTTVATLTGKELTAGNHFLTWNGLNTDGIKASSGNYSIIVTATDSTGTTVTSTPLVKSEVTGVDMDSTNGSTLITKNGKTPFSGVLGIYEQSATTDTATNTTTSTLATTTAVADTAQKVSNNISN